MKTIILSDKDYQALLYILHAAGENAKARRLAWSWIWETIVSGDKTRQHLKNEEKEARRLWDLLQSQE